MCETRRVTIGLLALCLMLSATACRQNTVKVQRIPNELLVTQECQTLKRGDTNDEMRKAYMDCKDKLEQSNIRIEAIRTAVNGDVD